VWYPLSSQTHVRGVQSSMSTIFNAIKSAGLSEFPGQSIEELIQVVASSDAKEAQYGVIVELQERRGDLSTVDRLEMEFV